MTKNASDFLSFINLF